MYAIVRRRRGTGRVAQGGDAGAQGAAPPAEVFDAVAPEMRHLLDADSARLWRYEPDSTVSLVVISDP